MKLNNGDNKGRCQKWHLPYFLVEVLCYESGS